MNTCLCNHFCHGPLKALVVDWAGTIIDYGSRAPISAFIELFRRYDVDITVEHVRESMGMAKRDHIRAITRIPEVADQWRRLHGRDFVEFDIETMYVAFLPLQRDCALTYSTLIHGTVDVINACRMRGLKIGSSTGYPREVMDVVSAAAYEQGFDPDTLVCASDIEPGRPAPWLILDNARRLNVYPLASIIKVDDTAIGITAGLNAGVWTVGVAKTSIEVGLGQDELESLSEARRNDLVKASYRRLSQAGAHYVIDSIADLLSVIDDIEMRMKNNIMHEGQLCGE